MAVAAAIGISGAVMAASSAYAAKKQSKAAKDAGKLEGAAASEALEWEKEQEAQRRKEYGEERERDWKYEDEDRALALADRQIKLQELARRHELQRPYQEFGGRSVATLQALMSPGANVDYHVKPGTIAAPPAAPPPGVPSMTAAMMPQPVLPPGTLAELASRRA